MAPIYALGSIINFSVFSTEKHKVLPAYPRISLDFIYKCWDYLPDLNLWLFFSRFELNFTVVSFLVIRSYRIAFH